MRNFYKNLKNLTLLAILLLGSVNAWGKTGTGKWSAKVYLYSAVDGATATAEVWRYNVASSDDNVSSVTATSTTSKTASYTEKTSLSNWALDSYYPKYSVSVPDGYSFGGWYNTSNQQVSTSETYYPREGSGLLSHGATDNNWSCEYKAKFNPVTVNSVSSNPISTSGTALKLTEPGNKTEDIKFTVSSNADAKADFNEPTISGTGWSIVSWSLSGTTVTVTVKYTATNATTQGDHEGTLTVTSKANSSYSATVHANVDLTPHLSASPTELDFGMFTVGVDASMRKTVTLTFDANAINFSFSSGINPFVATLSNDHKTLAIDFNPTEVGSWTKTITVTAKNNQGTKLSASQTITLKGQSQSKTYPTYTCNIQNAYMVDDAALDLQTLWTSTSNGGITYSIESYTEHGANNSTSPKPAITNNRYLSLGRACEITLKLTQAGATNYFADSDTKTITINKYQTSIDDCSAYNLMVDGVQTAAYNYSNTSAAQPTANSADNFYYTIDNVSFTNRSTNKGTNLVTFDPATKKITACNAGTAKITLHQKETYKFTGATKSFAVAVYKYNSTFADAANLNVKVDEESAASGYTLTYSKPNNAYIGTTPAAGNPTLNTGDYYYTLTQNVTSDNTTGSADASIAAAYDAGTKKATGKNAGTCTVSLYQQETYKFNEAETSFVVNVAKHDPAFTWNGGSATYYHNSMIDNVFSSSNTDFGYTIGSSTDAQVAYETGNKLYVLSKNGSAQFSVTQAANYKWNGKSQTYTVTPTSQSNHVPFTISNSNYTTFRSSTSSNVTWSNPGFRLCDGGWFEKDDEVVIAFTGIPDKLTFDRVLEKSAGFLPGTYECHVYASADGSNWGDAIWTLNERSESASANVQVPATARYLKFTYHGTVYCHYNNIKVTELKKFTPNPNTLDFGALDINTTGSDTQKTFEFNYANVGHNVTLSTDDSHFTVSPTSITNIGGEKSGKTTITVNYSTAELHKATGAKLTITDELSNSTNVTLKGETKKLTPTVSWSTDESIFIEDDELSATIANGLTVTLSVPEADAQYVHCEGNTATIVGYRDGTITVTATVTGNDIYNGATFTKDIMITNLTKQTITWTQDLSHFKTTDQTKSITLNGTASSGLPVMYEVVGDATGLTLTQNGNTWTLTYSTECNNTTLVAKQGGNSEYAPAASVSKSVKVIDPKKICSEEETLLQSTVTLKSDNISYNMDIPSEITINVSRTKTSWAIYSNGFDVEFYDGSNGTGNKIGNTHEYGASDINTSKTITIKGLDIKTKSVKLISHASNGYNVTSVTYKKYKYCTISDNSLAFETYPNTVSSTKTFNVNYANYPISVECSNPKFTVSPTEFGDCDEYDTKTISVYYTADAAEGTDNGYIYIKDNTGVTLKTCTLNVSISKVDQSITNHNIANTYNTTDLVTLTAETNSAAEEKHFTYSADPAGIASFDGNEMTFNQSGTIAITVQEAGSDVYKPCSTTVANVVVNKVTPTLTLPTGTSVMYLQNLSASTLSGGKATVTLHGEANREVAGSFAWTNGSALTNGAAGSNSYEVTFTPTDGGMYNPATGMVTITVDKANQSIVMNNGTVSVAVDKGLDANSDDAKLDLTSLIASQTTDAFDANRTGAVSFEVISDNAINATISGTIFSATAEGTYTVRATKAGTNYYNAATADFIVTANVRTNSMSIASACARYVEQEVTDVISNVNSDAAIQTSSTDATIAYYDVEHNKIVIPNSEAKSFDQKDVTITIWQNANARFAASGEKTIVVTVKKYDNQIYKSWATWSQTLNFDQKIPVRLWSDNSETALEINQTGDVSIATYYAYPSVDKDTIRAWYSVGTTTWSISQAETYKYKAAQAKTLTVTVQTLTSGDCYVLNETAEYDLFGQVGVETGDPMALSAPGKYLYFDAKRQAGGVNNFFIEYSTNGSQYKELGGEVELSASYETYGPFELPQGTTHIRFKTTTGATLTKHYKNVYVTRKTTFDLEDKDGIHVDTLNMPLNIVSTDPINVNSSKKSFWVDFNTCADEIRIASNHPYYTVKEADKAFSISATNGAGRREIEVIYTCAEADSSSAIISVYTQYEHRTITINGRTDKGTQEIIWKEPDFVNDTVSLPVGYSGIAATASSKLPVKYSILQGEDSVIRIAEDKYSFEVVGLGTAHLIVTQEGTATLHPVTGTRVINATTKKLQVIRWFQDLTNSLFEGDTVRLEAEVYVMNSMTGVYTKDAARTDSIRYTCPENNGKIVIFNKDFLRVIGTGETTITASVPGDDHYVEAPSITMNLNIHSFADTCKNTLLVDSKKQYAFEPEIDWGFSDLSPTKAEYGDTILINQAIGKPGMLSFDHMGEAFTVPLFGDYYQGYIKAQQRIRGAWVDVPNSRIAPTKGVWNELKDIQLDEDADAILIMREQGAYGYHYVKNVKVTMLPYLRAEEIIYISAEVGATIDTTITVQYANAKAALTAETKRKEDNIFAVRNTIFYPNCGTMGAYNWPVRFTPSTAGDWMDTLVIKDSGTEDSILVYIQASVAPGTAFVYRTDSTNGVWEDDGNWGHNGALPTADDPVIIANDVTIPSGKEVYVKSISVADTATIYVKGTLVIMESTPDRESYGNIHVVENGSVDLRKIPSGGALKIRDFILDASLGGITKSSTSGQIEGEEKLKINGDVYFMISFDPRGAIDYGWYDFTVPFEVDVMNGVYDSVGNKLTYNVDYAVMDFSEKKRAANEKYWNWFTGTLQPGKLYSITLEETKTWNTFIFKRKPKVTGYGCSTYEAECTAAADTRDRGWNGLGNGTLRHRQLNKETIVLVYDHEHDCYLGREAANYTYTVGTAFFVQVEEQTVIQLDSVEEARTFLAPTRNRQSIDHFRLSLTAEGTNYAADNLWFSASEEATEEYVIGHDLLKMGTPTNAKVAQMWSTKGGMQLCDVEASLVNNKANTPLSFFAPQDGIYTLSIDKAPADATLYLTYNNRVIWNLSMSPYELELTQGTTEGYGLRIVAAQQTTTDLENDGLINEANGIRKVLIDDKIYLVTPEGAVYDVLGKGVKY